MVRTFITIILLLFTAWCAITIHLLVVYGPLEGITSAMGGILLSILVCKRNHSHYKYDRKCECDRRCDHR